VPNPYGQNCKVWHKKLTKVYQALHPEHFSQSYLETSMGIRKDIAGGELYVIQPARNWWFFN